MKRLFPIVIVLLVVVLSGCTGRDTSSEMKGQIFERANLNINGKMMDIQLMPNDARAGEKITANFVVGNTGSESISSEMIEIKAKAKSLDDFLANIAVMLMSNEKKTVTFSNDYSEEIKPGMIKPFTHDFPTPMELRDRSLSGIYEVTIILSVNGQQVESKSMNLQLRSGKPRDGSNTQANTSSGTVSNTSSGTVSSTSTPMVTASASPATTVTAAPTPTPTPVAVTVEPTGKIYVTRIMSYKFGEPSLSIDADDTLQWYNLDDETMTVAEIDGKIPNQSVYSRRNYNFTTTGTYKFQLFYSKMRVDPPVQILTVKLNQSRS